MQRLAIVLQMLAPFLKALLTPEQIREAMDAVLDWLEDAAVASENKWDDVLVTTLSDAIREAFSIPDND